MRTLIANGTIVTADGSCRGDVPVDGETIAQVGSDVAAAGGTFAKDTFETGTRAAAFGGTTSIMDFAVQSKGQCLREGREVRGAPDVVLSRRSVVVRDGEFTGRRGHGRFIQRAPAAHARLA
jgi:hypothetical protein